jgi:hypothetical protein
MDLFAKGILHVCQHLLIHVAQEHEEKIPLDGDSVVFTLTKSTVPVTHVFLQSG